LIRLLLLFAAVLCGLALPVVGAPTTDARSDYSLSLSVISPSGGLVCGDPDYDLTFTLGEPVVGASSSASLLLWSGFVPLRHTCCLCPQLTGVGEPEAAGLPGVRLYLTGPNPATHAVRFLYEIDYPATVRLAIYDVLGRQVCLLHEGPVSADAHEIVWDGRNDGGRQVASGVYLARLSAGSRDAVERFVIVR
jgi:hypothetical protein